MGATRLGLGIGLLLGLAWGQPTVPSAASVKPAASASDSIKVQPAGPLAAPGPILSDSLRSASPALKKDTLASRPKSRSDSVIVVKHEFNHKEQIITGSLIMTCLALMLVAMNNYNPR